MKFTSGCRKKLMWIASSKKDLLSLPREIQREIGYSLNLAQQGEKDPDSKPLKGFNGATVLEIVKNNQDGTYRAIYTVKFEDSVYVLHVFQKKSKTGIKTDKQDIELVKERLKTALRKHLESQESLKV